MRRSARTRELLGRLSELSHLATDPVCFAKKDFSCREHHAYLQAQIEHPLAAAGGARGSFSLPLWISCGYPCELLSEVRRKTRVYSVVPAFSATGEKGDAHSTENEKIVEKFRKNFYMQGAESFVTFSLRCACVR